METKEDIEAIRVNRANAQIYSERLYSTLSEQEKEIVKALETMGYLIPDRNLIGRCGKFNPEK